MSFAIEPSTEIAFRADFSLLANARGYKDAVEVGVDLGVFAREFLSRWSGNWLIGVDPYAPYIEMEYDRSGDMAVAVAALTKFHGRFRLVRHRSPEAIPFVRSFITPQFVYVDGSHEKRDVKADIEAWWDALPPDGLIGGHDWDAAHPGVISAVKEFARERDVVVRLTRESGGFPPSWYIYRNEPTRLIQKYFVDGDRPNPYRVVERA